MGQINKGTTFVTGQQVTAANLNNLVDNATLQPSAISAQTAITTVPDTNTLLTANSGGTSLNKVTLANMVTSLNLAKTNTAQNFSNNITMVSGSDIALTSGSILSLPAGAVMSLSSGATLTLGQDPVSGLQAVTKNYADNNFLNKTTGGTVSGPLNVSGAMLCSSDITMIGTGSVITLSADPVADLQAATKAYVDTKAVASTTQIAAIRFKSTATPGTTTTVQYAAIIAATVTRPTLSSIATLVFTDAQYFDTTSPFFVVGQYIGLQLPATGTGVGAKLFKILSVTPASKTITIQTDATTAVAATTQNLSVVYINSTPPSLPSMLDANGNKNIKSVYVCLASNKNYINYWYDSETGDKTSDAATSATIPSLRTTLVSGQAVTRTDADYPYFMSAIKMVEIQSATGNAALSVYSRSYPLGFDVTSKGAHVGYFWDLDSGTTVPYVWDAHVVISK
jgi:hypothetical protein